MSTKTPIKRLLVIDDEENMRHMLSTVLGKGGYFVDTASDGSEGLKMIDEAHYDYVLCDIKMPKMSGMDEQHHRDHDVGLRDHRYGHRSHETRCL
jgi:two-component system response regulator AtoC